MEKPSLREIFAATFRDRVVHHLLYNFLEPIFEPKFIYASFACRKNKGIHQSLGNLQKHLRKITANHHKPAYYLHLDIRGFFMALDKEVLFSLIAKQVKNPEILWLAKLIIFNDPVKNFTSKGEKSLFALLPPYKSLFHVPENQGLPIGNLTSQFFANVYMNELDQFVKHNLRAKYYSRYVDDFLLLAETKAQLLCWRDKIGHFLKQRLKLELHPTKQILQATSKGIDWLGYVVKPDCVLVRRRSVKTFKRKLFQFNQTLAEYPNSGAANGQLALPFPENDPPLETIEKILATVNSYFGLFQHANTYRLRNDLWANHFGLLKNYFEPKSSSIQVLKIKSDFLERSKRAGK